MTLTDRIADVLRQDPRRQRMSDIDPEGFTRYGGDCICGPVYTYAGVPEPGGFAPDCPMHSDTPGDTDD